MKKNIIIVLSITLLITISALVYVFETRIASSQIPLGTITVEPTSSTTQPTKEIVIEVKREKSTVIDISDIEYTTLEKDRLYTKEEGKYENLSEAGKELLRSVLTSPKCANDPNGVHCDESMIINSSIVALKNNILLSNTPSIKGFSSYAIYALKQKEMFIDSVRSSWAQNRDNKFVVIVNNDYAVIDERLTTTNQNLLYYKPGMTEFKLIPSSNIQSKEKESYLYNVGMNLFIPEGNFKDHIVTMSIFDNKYMQFKEEYREEYPPTQLREVTFDLNLLP